MITLGEKLGEGAYADVWEAKDDLGRTVAVKIVRPSAAVVADALAHARALARVDHPNVVRVFSIDKVDDPETGARMDCVVMERVHGETLRARLEEGLLSRSDAQRIGAGLIDGVAEIHRSGIAHGDLHTDNVMVGEKSVKILDILYADSMALMATLAKRDRFRRDMRALRLILQEVITHSELDPAEAAEFNNALSLDAGIEEIARAFTDVTSLQAKEDLDRQLEHAFGRFRDEAFVDSAEYADALADETARSLSLPLMRRIVDERAYEPKRREYVVRIWQRLEEQAQKQIGAAIAAQLEREMPKGVWWPNLQLLSALGKTAWDGMPKIARLRLEAMVVNDCLAGYVDIHRADTRQRGAIGTYANSLWQRFSKPTLDRLAENLLSLLQQGWYTQNYVGKYFMYSVPGIAERTGTTKQFIDALIVAHKNDARLVKANLDRLPRDWRELIEAGTRGD